MNSAPENGFLTKGDSTYRASKKIPITLLTGFLGSGKTTVLNYWLQQPALADTLVIINEYGEVSLDHQLVISSTEQVVMAMENGCLCCSVRHDLIQTLNDSHWRFSREGKRQFRRVLIETTGLADPASIIHTLTTHPQLVRKYQLETVVTTVDTLTAETTLDHYEEARRQVAVADVLLLTKGDLVGEEKKNAVFQRLQGKHSAAKMIFVEEGAVNPQDIFNKGIYSPEAGLYAGTSGASPTSTSFHFFPSTQTLQASDVVDLPFHHNDGIQTLTLVIEKPIRRERLEGWLAHMQATYGSHILRMKGIVNLEGKEVPYVIHGVQHQLFPPAPLPVGAVEDHFSRIVFITNDIECAEMQAQLDDFRAQIMAS
ncbi:P-loop guanosine triphosphatase YjiA [Halomonadaceae bacterium LMG 33818]|uniref:CobW family GTP-binding protein n=1 Tax=Cernens ardua TaxID=3402176 RepID=UPI003EDBBC0C